MANYNSFLFDGHGYSEVDGSFDPGAASQGVKEHDLVTTINGFAKEFLGKTSLAIHYDEQNYLDKDFLGNSYSSKAGLSVHINAGGGTGVEIYVPITEKYLTFDIQLANELSQCMGIPNRGVKSRDYNSGNTVQRTNGVAIGGTDYYKEIRDAWNSGLSLAILEVGFVDTSDLQKMQKHAREIGYYIAKYICNICGVQAPAFSGEVDNVVLQESSHGPVSMVKIVNNAIYVLDGPSPNHNILKTIYKNEVYAVSQVQNGYGKIDSGWINMKYTTPLVAETDSSFKVRIVNNAIYVLDGPSPDNNIVQTIYKDGVYTIVENKNGYGRLKSGAGWINLKYTQRL